MAIKMDQATQVQYLDKAVCISYSANIFGKDMNVTILHSAMSK